MKRWLCILTLIVAVFIGIKEASAQKRTRKDTVSNKQNNSNNLGGIWADPSFPGGDKAFGDYLHQNLRQPKDTKGRVITSFIIEKDGSITDVRVLRGLNKEADEEAIRVLQKSPKWNPCIQAGMLIRTAYTMPINFDN